MAKSDRITRVYQYGLLPPDCNADLVREQMRLAHRYYNDLISIERGRRAAERELLASHRGIQWLTWATEYWQDEATRAERAIKANRAASRARSETAPMREAYAMAKRQLTQARKTLAFGRALVRASGNMTALFKRQSVLKKSARKHSGVYWGTYLLAENAADAAAKVPLFDGATPNDPHFRRWDGSAQVSAQIQGGMDASEIMGCQDKRARIADVTQGTPSRGRRFCRLMLRVGSDDNRAPVWAEWPMLMDRPMPEGSRIKIVTVSCRRDGYRERWTVELTLDMPKPKARTAGTVGIDIGWRVMGDELRVAYWMGDDGQEGELRLDNTMLSQLTKASSLRAIRDRAMNAMREKLVAGLRDIELPAWLRQMMVRRGADLPSSSQALTYIGQWRSAARFTTLWRKWGEALIDGATILSAYEVLDVWHKQDHHLWLWETEQRHQALERRKHLYRNFAAKLATRYALVGLEKFDLRTFATRQPVDGDAENDTACSNRQLAATSILRDAVKHAFSSRGGRHVAVPAANTTRRCAKCGAEVLGDAAATVILACANGHVEDQDRNAAANILASASGGSAAPTPGGARSTETIETEGEVASGRWDRKKREKRNRQAARNSVSNVVE